MGAMRQHSHGSEGDTLPSHRYETSGMPLQKQRHPDTLQAGAYPRRITLIARTIALVLILSMVVSVLAYQSPPSGSVAIGWLGDRLFLDASTGLGANEIIRGDLYADDLTPDSPTGRSRWTRQHATLLIPNIGANTELELTLLAQGWPTDVIAPAVEQPVVTVQADGVTIGDFTPISQWQTYTFSIPADVRTDSDLVIDLFASATFTDTERGVDPRPKGIRLAEAHVYQPEPPLDHFIFMPPAWGAVTQLALAMLLLYGLLIRLFRSTTVVFTLAAIGAGLASIGLAIARIWMGAALSVTLVVLVIALAFTWQRPLLDAARSLVRRYSQGRALGYGIVTAALVWLGYTLAQLSRTYRLPGPSTLWERFPDTLMYGLLGTGLLALAFVMGREGLPRIANGIVAFIGRPRPALIITLALGGVWIGYEALIIADIAYVGHADYSDNAIVARNLIAGRGWTVDYISQFYRLYDGTTRPQETWPLLQPVWIAPFIALFGPHAWAIKLPNLIFNTILLLLIYHIGARIWDRRVGMTAALLTLTSIWFFNLTIYATSDLAFVVFALGAIYAAYRSADHSPSVGGGRGTFLLTQRSFLLAGALTGLMMLQKPSGAIIAAGIGIWLVRAQVAEFTLRNTNRQAAIRQLATRMLPVTLWAATALIILSPYLVRNLALFGKPVYSTESHDAWVLGYRGDSGDAWEEIYRIYAPDLGGIGIPNRSWILRWGFDQTLAKIQNQTVALRDYLMPAWTGLPQRLSVLSSRLSDEASKNLLSPIGAWLATLGVIAALRSRRRLLSLLVFAFVPYMLFMVTYWRANEERYWVMLIPWIALLAGWVIWGGFDRLAQIGDGRWSPLGFILVFVAIAGIIQPSWPDIAEKIQDEPGLWSPDLIAYNWLEQQTTPDAVIMTRNPWQLQWHTERPAVMIPNTAERTRLMEIARRYNAEYLALENLQRVKGDGARTLAALLHPGDAPIGAVIDGFTLVYASPTSDNRAFIYRFPEDYR